MLPDYNNHYSKFMDSEATTKPIAFLLMLPSLLYFSSKEAQSMGIPILLLRKPIDFLPLLPSLLFFNYRGGVQHIGIYFK